MSQYRKPDRKYWARTLEGIRELFYQEGIKREHTVAHLLNVLEKKTREPTTRELQARKTRTRKKAR